MKKNSIKERAKVIPKAIKLKVRLHYYWLKVKSFLTKPNN